jgi:hypothetical protein
MMVIALAVLPKWPLLFDWTRPPTIVTGPTKSLVSEVPPKVKRPRLGTPPASGPP